MFKNKENKKDKEINEEKIFLLMTNYRFGDILISDTLIQNIKKIYKNSKVIILTNENTIDFSKHLKGVDDAIIWDRKNKDKGLINTIKYALNFKYKNIYCAIPMYGSDRMILLSLFLKAKYILFYKKNNIFQLFSKSKYKLDKMDTSSVQKAQLKLLKGITKEKLNNYPIRYEFDKIENDLINDIKNSKDDYIALNPLTMRMDKDFKNEFTCSIIEKFKDKKILLLGQGKKAEELSNFIEKKKYPNLINLINKTSMNEVANYLSIVKGLISSDTGTMHLACSVNCPVVSVFFIPALCYRPDDKIYKIKIIDKNQTIQNVYDSFIELTK